jgi:hypothetical protein
MDPHDPLEQIAAQYRAEGYEVILHPSASELPHYLADTRVDVLARKGDHIVALQMAEGPDGALRLGAEVGRHAGMILIEEAELHLHPQALLSSVVMGWAAFEAAARAVLGIEKAVSLTPRQAVEQLRVRGLINDEEYALLMDYMRLRNAVVHGVVPDNIPAQAAPFLLDVARRLLRSVSTGGSFHMTGPGAAAVVLRAPFKDRPAMKAKVEKASEVLFELLGRSRGTVLLDWDIAEGDRSRETVVLKLSDSTGMVTATLDPWEFEDMDHLRSRLNRLWGDLLQIRSHRQVRQIQELTGK